MSFSTRLFLFYFVPFILLLTASFWAIQHLVESNVRNGLLQSLRLTHDSVARLRSKVEFQNTRFLKVAGENGALKARLRLLMAARNNGEVRVTVEDQLREICEGLRFDFLMVSSADGAPLAGVMRNGEHLVALDVGQIQPPSPGFVSLGGRDFKVASMSIGQDEQSIGVLSAGEHFELSEFSTPAVLARDGRVIKSSIPEIPIDELEAALKHCPDQTECEVRLRNQTYISLPMASISFGAGYVLRSLQNVDSANGPVQAILRNIFVMAGIASLFAAGVISVFSSRSIARPIAGVVSQLRESEKIGLLPEFHAERDPIYEIRQLCESFNRAASAIRQGRESLYTANVEFVESLASALDARDRYTAGHSRRVSRYSCAIAKAMNMPGEELETLRVGALLHDIGKIGVADSILNKPSQLTADEYALLQEHPTIGRKILEGVHGFHSYLPTVELHHENWMAADIPWDCVELRRRWRRGLCM